MLPWQLSWQRICLQWTRPWFNSWVGKIPWRRERLPTPVFLGFPGGSDGEESTSSGGNLGLIPELGRPRGGRCDNLFQYSFLENPHEESNGLQSMRSQRVGYDRMTKHSTPHLHYSGSKHLLKFTPWPPLWLHPETPPCIKELRIACVSFLFPVLVSWRFEHLTFCSLTLQ